MSSFLPRRARGIADEVILYFVGLVVAVVLLGFLITHRRAESPALVVGPGAKVTTTQKVDGGGWGFGAGVVVTLIVVVGGVIMAQRRQR
ncbi:MAG TPA: hypothetical protein VGP72_01745 [Planctomycetota bacterium]|jgi:hypothetical protein